MLKIAEEPWNYILYQYEEKLIMSVLCGTNAMYEITIQLTEEAEHLKK